MSAAGAVSDRAHSARFDGIALGGVQSETVLTAMDRPTAVSHTSREPAGLNNSSSVQLGLCTSHGERISAALWMAPPTDVSSPKTRVEKFEVRAAFSYERECNRRCKPQGDVGP